MACDLLDEHVVTAGWFNRSGRWGDDGLRAVKAVRRWLSTSDHPADRVAAWGVLALTPTRLAVLNGRYERTTPPVVARNVLHAPRLEDVRVAVRRHRASATLFNSTGSTTTTAFRRLTITTAGDPRPLVLDLLDGRLAREVLRDITAAVPGAPPGG